MELYVLGSLLGLGYYLNKTTNPTDDGKEYPKRMYRGNIYDQALYDKVENEIFDRAAKQHSDALNIYQNNSVLRAPTDTVYNSNKKLEYARTVEDFSNIEQPHMDENGNVQDVPCNMKNCLPPRVRMSREGFVGNANTSFPELQATQPPAVGRPGGSIGGNFSATKSWATDEPCKQPNCGGKSDTIMSREIAAANDDAGIDPQSNIQEQFELLEKGGKAGVKQVYDQPWHNNMVPFFGGSVKQNVDPLLNESKLNMFTGQWDYSKKQKQEISPMFAPTKNIKNVYGDQQYLHKLEQNLDRWIPSLMRKNEAPTEKIYVAPGLNLGYDEKPSFGFHEVVRVLPKDTNELRAKNKPKLTYDRPVVSGKSYTQEGTSRPNVAKNRPELVVYNEKGERTFGAKAHYVREMERPVYLLGRALRSISKSFFGVAADVTGKKAMNTDAYKGKTRRSNFNLEGRQGPAVVGVKQHTTVEGLINYDAKETNRQTFEDNKHSGYFNSVIKAVTNYIAPPKATVKESTLAPTQKTNMRAATYKVGVRNGDVAKATVKACTEANDRQGNMGTNRKRVRMYNPDDKARNTVRQTVRLEDRKGVAKTAVGKNQMYNPDNKAKNTVRQSVKVQDYKGGLASAMKKGKAYDVDQQAKYVNRQDTYQKDYMAAAKKRNTPGAHEVLDVEVRYTSRQDIVESEKNKYTGNAANSVPARRTYDTEYNATTNALKEKVAEGRAPTQNSVKIAAGVDFQNVDIKKLASDGKNPRGMEVDLPNVDSRLMKMTPTANPRSMTKDKNTVCSDVVNQRIEPAILDAFRNNPYTQSLSSYAFP